MTSALTIYAAGPIDLGTDLPNWRGDLINIINSAGYVAVMFDPASAFKNASWGALDVKRSLYIEQLNKFALELSSTFIACVPKNVPSVGTPIEIEFADKASCTSYLLTDIEPGKSVYLDNRFDEYHRILVDDMNDNACVRQALYKLADALINDAKGPKNHFHDDE